MPIQFHGAMAPVERARFVVPDIDADAMCPVLEKPSREKAEQLRSDVSSTVLWDDIDPLDLAVATEPAGEVPGDVADRRPPHRGHPHRSRQKRLLWVVFAGQISQHPLVASGFAFSRQSDQFSYIRQIRFSVLDCGHRTVQATRYVVRYSAFRELEVRYVRGSDRPYQLESVQVVADAGKKPLTTAEKRRREADLHLID